MKDEQAEITPVLLLHAYAAGVFPMAESRAAGEMFWVDPRRRGVLPLDGLHVSRSLARTMRRGGFEIRIDSAFTAVLEACADRPETWINPEIVRLYSGLYRMGHAHSIEVWIDNDLAGGLYGVSLGAAFFGESMFSRVRDASKIALVALVARLRAGGFRLLDTQFVTDHLARLGVVEISRADYHRRLAEAVVRPADFQALPPDLPPQRLLQLATHIS